jgi:hypothetical protein
MPVLRDSRFSQILDVASFRGAHGKRVCADYIGNGYGHEAHEVMNCLRRGEKESQRMPLSETIEILNTMDVIRSSWFSQKQGLQTT